MRTGFLLSTLIAVMSIAAAAPAHALGQAAGAASKPPCRMSDPDVQLTADGWAGPNCVTTKAGSTGQPPPEGAYRDVPEDDEAPRRHVNRPRRLPLCEMGDHDVHLTADGWAGPNCIASKDGTTPTHPRDYTNHAEDGARYRAGYSGDAGRKPLCTLGSPGVDLTPDGWSGPNCITSKDGTTPTHPADGAREYEGSRSCLKSAGASRANEMVSQCLKVSGATHPPCDLQNSCALIRSEIRRGCAQLTSHAPSFCDDYR